MDTLRRPLLIAALVLIALAVLVETGAGILLPRGSVDDADLRAAIQRTFGTADAGMVADLRQQHEEDARPGLGIPYLALIDGIVLFTVALMTAGLLVPERVQGRLQGVLTLIVSLLLTLLAVVLIVVAVALLILMLSLLFAAPFGTITYFAVFGFFDRTGAGVTLALVTALKVGFAVCLVLAQQRFLQNRGLVLLILTSLIATVIVSLLHGFVPRPLVSITDAIAAIVVGVLAVIWALGLLAGAVVAIVKSAQPAPA